MLIKKNTCHILIFLFLSILYGQIEEKEPKTLFFGLLKFDTNSPYEDGYWINKWFYAREFAAPVNFIPIEVRQGFGVSGKSTGNWLKLSRDSFKVDTEKIKYDSSAASNPILQKKDDIWGPSIEIDIGLINIPHYVVGTSWMNVMTGITYRSSSILVPTLVPNEEWGKINSSWGDSSYFAPQLTEFLVTSNFQYQPFNEWFLNFRYSYGLASALFSTPDKEIWDETPSGSGTSAAYAAGIRFILDPGKANRFTVGLDFRYSYTKIHTILDPNDITPVNSFALQNYGLYLTLSAFYGGRKTVGDEAKGYYYRKDYQNALKTFNRFMVDYPSHSNRHRAEEYIADCEYKIPYELMEEGVTLEKEGKTERALKQFQYARSRVKNDTLILKLLEGRIDQIALLWMIEAEKRLNEERYIDAYNLVKLVAEFSTQGKKEIRRFKSWVVLGEGEQYQEAGFIGKAMGKYAEALEMNADLVYEVKALQYKAGIQMAKLASQADEFEEIQLAIHSLEFARDLSGGIGKRNEQLLIDLRVKLKSLDEYRSRALIERRMSLARSEQARARTKKLEIGQTLPQVQDLLGDPHEKIFGGNSESQEEQLWIYFLNGGSLHLSFHHFQLFKIEEF